jgi:hypothetical protein
MSEPGSEVVEPGNETGSMEVVRVAEQIIKGTRLDQQAAERAVQIHEWLAAMLNNIVGDLPIRNLMDSVARERKWPTFDEWRMLAVDVCHLKRSMEEIITEAYVSRDEPWELYKLALTIKDRWVSWRRAEAYRAWQKQDNESQLKFEDVLDEFGVPELEASWSQIIDGLRWLTSHTKATLQP